MRYFLETIYVMFRCEMRVTRENVRYGWDNTESHLYSLDFIQIGRRNKSRKLNWTFYARLINWTARDEVPTHCVLIDLGHPFGERAYFSIPNFKVHGSPAGQWLAWNRMYLIAFPHSLRLLQVRDGIDPADPALDTTIISKKKKK